MCDQSFFRAQVFVCFASLWLDSRSARALKQYLQLQGRISVKGKGILSRNSYLLTMREATKLTLLMRRRTWLQFTEAQKVRHKRMKYHPQKVSSVHDSLTVEGLTFQELLMVTQVMIYSPALCQGLLNDMSLQLSQLYSCFSALAWILNFSLMKLAAHLIHGSLSCII